MRHLCTKFIFINLSFITCVIRVYEKYLKQFENEIFFNMEQIKIIVMKSKANAVSVFEHIPGTK